MPATYTLISSNVLTTTTASVTFSSIPATYTDLLIKLSLRSNSGSAGGGGGWLRFNSVAGTAYSSTDVRGNGSAAASSRDTSSSLFYFTFSVGGTTATANTFSSGDLYIPSYTVAQNKPIGTAFAYETNATAALIQNYAGLFSNTSAISSLNINCDAGDWVSGSSFYLYGISNA
jgi:hypothetical protein